MHFLLSLHLEHVYNKANENNSQDSQKRQVIYRFLVAVHGFLSGEVLEALGQFHRAGLLGYGQRQVPERVESDGAVAAMGAAQRGLELAHEDVHDFRVVHAQVSAPGLGRFLFVTAIKNQSTDSLKSAL